MELSDRRVWRCRICRMETTPRCPFCHVIIGLREAQEGQCAACRAHLPESMADCPNCEAPRALYFSPSIAYPEGRRASLLLACRSGRVLLGVVQFIGFILFAVSFSGILDRAAEGQSAAPIPFRGIGLSLFLPPFPFQVFLTYAAFRLRRVPVHIGHGP